MTYQNPIYPEREFPDPFVFKFCGTYYGFCTGFWRDNNVFGVISSRDLVNWNDCGGAMNALEIPDTPFYWAPEVSYFGGKFYLYYSVGNEENMQIRVAVSDTVTGKYVDSGNRLTNEIFAIDAHVFVDDDGTRWLFYATDFLDYERIGTGTVRDKMLSPFELEGKPQPVTRAAHDWQIYDPNRASKGGVRWHTIEGSTVLKRKSIYYQMFSGGNWQNESYGVSYATTRSINDKSEWIQKSDGVKVLPILQTIPGKVIAPGHNSVVRGVDNFEHFCVYHRWADDLSGRLLAIDKLDFAGERMFVLGASHTPQPVPNLPNFSDNFDTQSLFGLGSDWISANDEQWLTGSGAAISNPILERCEATCRVESENFLVEFSAKAIDYQSVNAAYGFALKRGENDVLSCEILPHLNQIEVICSGEKRLFGLPDGFDTKVIHLWRVEVDCLNVKIKLDEAAFHFRHNLETAPNRITLSTRKTSAAFAGFALTTGFENLFDDEHLTAHGWRKPDSDEWQVAENKLFCRSLNGETSIYKDLPLSNFEFIVNAKFEKQVASGSSYGFLIRRDDDSTICLTVGNDAANYHLQIENDDSFERFALPQTFNPNEFQQFRFRQHDGTLHLQLEKVKLGEIKSASATSNFGLLTRNAETAFDAVRVVSIND
ncbi:MAG: family 43 glycosylhydrolase [Pyrinomonadaceae bacterium]|nr:family 43 glycosylhydrolase [Pyrinomonadaceae bacterium]